MLFSGRRSLTASRPFFPFPAEESACLACQQVANRESHERKVQFKIANLFFKNHVAEAVVKSSEESQFLKVQ